MITIISGTNRIHNYSDRVAALYQQLLEEQGITAKLLSLIDLPPDFMSPGMYKTRSKAFEVTQEKLLVPAEKFIFIVPEYNGSLSGVLKLMIDGCDVSRCYFGKKACLVGVASGRSGNIRGLDHLTGILNHVQVNVLYDKVKITGIEQRFDAEGNINDKEINKRIRKQLERFLAF